MQAELHAIDLTGLLATLQLRPDTPDESDWLETDEFGWRYRRFENLRTVVNAALEAAGHGDYLMQLPRGRQGEYYVFSIGLAPRRPVITPAA